MPLLMLTEPPYFVGQWAETPPPSHGGHSVYFEPGGLQLPFPHSALNFQNSTWKTLQYVCVSDASRLSFEGLPSASQ